jgi:hypothetical protein
MQKLAHPYLVQDKPCTLLIDEIEALWAAIAERDDWTPLTAKLADIQLMAAAYG